MDERYIDALKAIADANRLRLFWLLVHIDGRICVAEAMDVLGDSYYNVSRNLRMLQKAGLVTPKKEGKWVFYTLKHISEPFFSSILTLVRSISENEFTLEIKRCRLRLSMRQDGQCIVGPNSEKWQSICTKAKCK